MTRLSVPALVSFAALGAGLACREAAAPARRIPATLEVVSSPITSAVAGTSAGNFTVRVRDAVGEPVPGVVVLFTLSRGSAGSRVSPAADTSDANGDASTALTVGTALGQHEVTASLSGVASVKSSTVASVPGAAHHLALAPRSVRFLITRDSTAVTATARDSLGNATGQAVIWISRDPALVSVVTRPDNSGTVRVQSRPGQTYLVASSGGGAVTDSVLVSVVDAGASPCLYAASPTTLAVGESVAFDNGAVCLQSPDADGQYTVITHLNTSTSAVVVSEVTATGIIAPAAAEVATASSELGYGRFETRLRERERLELGRYVDAARSWWRSRPTALVAPVREGDRATFNVNPFDFCTNPTTATARVAAVTQTAIILADVDNPPGGFTDEEYRAFGLAMDTLVSPVDTAAFGSPSDIDGNGRVEILFTKAVNEIAPGAPDGGVALGFFYGRDLLPRSGVTGSCPGSNVGEMFYILVPDPDAVVGNARSKAFVENIVVSTIAHEYQHLINASRRMYITHAPSVNEEVWLNEGLSHIAEELVFYRAAKLQPRQNIGADQLQSGSQTRELFDLYMRGNIARYQQYLRLPALNSPISTIDLLGTRGATWAFLRFLADRASPADGDPWHRLVNSQRIGFENLADALNSSNADLLGALRDWSVSVLADDQLPSVSAFQELSWNFVSAMPAVGLSFDLFPATLINALPHSTTIRAGGSVFQRFAVPQGKEALLLVTGFSGGPMPPALRLMVLRTR